MLQVYLFGKCCIRYNGQVLEGVDAKKVQELFCYLLLHRDHTISREALASVLWPDTSTSLSKKNLRQALWQLQSTLDSQILHLGNRILLVQAEQIQLNPTADLWLDVDVFEQTFASVQKITGQKLKADQAQNLHRAVELYRKPLLECWYEDWCLQERERLQTMYLFMLDKLMDYTEMHRDYETGLFDGMRSLRYERTRESTHQRLMRLYYFSGDRASALRQYEQCTAILDEEFGVKPSRQTVALYQQLLTDQIEEPHYVENDPETEAEGTNLRLLEVFNSLSRLQVSLDELQQQVQQNLQQVEPLLGKAQKRLLSSSQRCFDRHQTDT